MHPYITPTEITAEQIKEKRKELGLTQKEMAELIGVSKPTVERWETSERPINGPVVLLLYMLDIEYVKKISIPPKDMPLRLWYMHRDKVCTLIDIDERKQRVKIRNYTAHKQFRAFGANEDPNFEDYEEFLRSRCFPESRDKMKLILKDLNLPFYDPLMIVERTEGRMAEDDFWIKVER